MPRPRKCRRVSHPPQVSCFKPRGIPLRDLTEVYLTVEGYEALRLADLEGLGHQEAAERMGVSRHTFGRVLAEARRAVAEALVNGYALHINGGDYVMARSRRPAPGQELPPPQPQEVSMEKIAISSEGPTLEDLVDPRFGRAAGFVIVDPQSMATSYLDNGASQARAQGAGIQAAEVVARAGVKVVLTGFVGPKAFQALQAVGIQIGQDLGGVSVRQALERYLAGQVPMATTPNREAPGGR
jgi:predicted DNA-binding protein (UPF0251 family)/predicted Fe-Mo cluster-binding NifX family protein